MNHRRFRLNTKGRDFVVGDIHGCLDVFRNHLTFINFNGTKDRMFSVGDLIDRGSSSGGTLGLLKKPWFFAVRGNHEQMMIDAMLYKKNIAHWELNGGTWHNNYFEETLKEWAIQLLMLPFAITVETNNGDVGISHAEPPSLHWKDTLDPTDYQKNLMLWARNYVSAGHIPEHDVIGVTKTYHGHTPVKKTIQIANMHFIDTGAVYSGRLTITQI